MLHEVVNSNEQAFIAFILYNIFCKYFTKIGLSIASAIPAGMLLIPGTGNGERGTGNGERGTGNGEPGTGVWELMYSGNPLENSKWRSKQKKGS